MRARKFGRIVTISSESWRLGQAMGLTDYAAATNMSVESRLELFMRICDAVQHAHHKGIIHRDLKPSNVLVMEVEGRPLPKVIDFGVAKAIDTSGDGDSKSLATQVGQLIGTPEYMAPEVFIHKGYSFSSDLWSLGAILYELLAGKNPFV